MSEKKNKPKPETLKHSFFKTEKEKEETIATFTEQFEPNERTKYGEIFETFIQTVSNRLVQCKDDVEHLFILTMADRAFPRIMDAVKLSFIDWIEEHNDEISKMSKKQKTKTRQGMFNRRVIAAYEISAIETADHMGINLEFICK
jgi:hypothetical protein